MMADAERFAAEDVKKKELVDARNMAESLVYQTEKSLRDAGDKVSAEDKKNVEEKTEAVKKLKDSQDAAEIKKATEELSAAAQKIGEALYKAQSSSAQASDGQADKQKPPEQTVEQDPHKEQKSAS